MAEEQEVKLMVIMFESHTENVRTNDPVAEMSRIMNLAPGKVLSVIYDGKIIYTKNRW